MTPEERARTIANLDLHEGRGPVQVLTEDGIRDLLSDTRRIAVIGASDDPARASNDVIRNLVASGFECVPVNPNVASVAGMQAYPNLIEAVAAAGPVDIVDVFRRAELCAPHAHEAVAVGARCLWLQLGIVDWESATIARDGGLSVVMDRCLWLDYRRFGRHGSPRKEAR